jgi:hypothetical protein
MTEFQGTARFSVRRCLGSGGMGVVYLAHDGERGVDVALKTLARVDARGIAGLKNEFRALADVTHPNLVGLHELFNDDGQWFFTMEVVEGKSFLEHVSLTGPDPGAVTVASTASVTTAVPSTVPRDLLRAALDDDAPRGPKVALGCDLGRLRPALRQLCEAVAAIHAAGKLHRDVKPTNVLITPEGRVVILDFGLAIIQGGRRVEPGSVERLIEGTPAYMAPEQTLGEPVLPASDWYAVGAMLYEALTGKLPFTGDYRRIIAAKRVKEPHAPSLIARDVPDDLDQLCVALLRRLPGDRPQGPEILRRVGGSLRGASGPVSGPASRPAALFVGRARELAALQEAFARAAAGQTAVVHLRGRSGMGKSALVEHFLDDVWRHRRALVLSGRCYERESVPYKAWDSLIDALGEHLQRLTPQERFDLMPPGAHDLARVFPVLLDVDTMEEETERRDPVDDQLASRRRAFDALEAIFRSLGAKRPLVLHIDDLQWGDVDSAKLMTSLLAREAAPPLLLVCSYRSDEAAASEFFHELRRAETAGRRPSATVVIDVERLPPDEAEALARSLLQDHPDADELGRAVAREADGSPFFVDELVRELREADTASAASLGQAVRELSLDGLLRARIGRLPADVGRLLSILAVAARPVEQGLAARAAEVPDAAAALAALRGANLIRTRGPRPKDLAEPYHDRVREVVVRSLDEARLREHHRALARELEAGGDADDEALAVHFEGAGERESAARYAARAAAHALDALAFDRAARLYRRALALGADGGSPEKRRALHVSLGEALVHAGRGAEAAPVFLAAAEGAPQGDVLELRRRAAEQFLISGHIDEGAEVLGEVMASVGIEYPETPLRATLALLGRLGLLRLRGTKFKERREQEIAPAELARIDVCFTAAKGLVLVDPVRGFGFQAQYLLLALDAGDPHRVCVGLALQAINVSLAGGGGYPRARALLDQAREIAERRGDPYLLGVVGNCGAATQMCFGHWRATVEASARANKILRGACSGVAWEVESGIVCAEVSLLWMGRLDELAAFVREHVREALDRGDLFAATYARMHTWYAPIAADDVDRARVEMREAIGRWSQGGFHIIHYWALYAETQYDLYAGNPEGARERLTRDWRALDGSNVLRVQFHRTLITLLRGTTAVAAAVAAGKGVGSRERAKLLREAEKDVGRLSGEEMPYATAAAALLRACVAAARGRAGEARTLLEAAENGFLAADMTLFAACARRRRGEMLGGDEGRALVADADAVMRGQGIVRPDRWTGMYAPGW